MKEYIGLRYKKAKNKAPLRAAGQRHAVGVPFDEPIGLGLVHATGTAGGYDMQELT